MHAGVMRVIGAVCLVLVAAACHTTLEGRLKPGLPGKDTIVSRYEVPYEQVYEAAKAVLKESGTLVSDDQVSNTLRARIDNNTVWIKLDSSEPRITTMSVEARTSGGAPHVDLASEIDKRIYGRLITTSR
jgi:hypothetical protein